MTDTQIRTTELWLPQRGLTESINQLDASKRDRIEVTGELDQSQTCVKVRVPAGWKLVGTDVSYYQRRLVDESGREVAKVFYKDMGRGGHIELIKEAA